MSGYPAGTVAMATVLGVSDVRVFRVGSNESGSNTFWVANYPSRRATPADGDVTDVRPLVVLDPEDYQQVRGLVQFSQYLHPGAVVRPLTEALQRGLRSLVTPLRIPEPSAPLTEVEASTPGRERRRLVRGLERGGGGRDVRWVDGVSSWSWHELIDPTLIREGIES